MKCDQCHAENGFRNRGSSFRVMQPAKYTARLAGAKTNLCKGHLKRLKEEAHRRRIHLQFEEIE